jgi:hypothetical protein
MIEEKPGSMTSRLLKTQRETMTAAPDARCAMNINTEVPSHVGSDSQAQSHYFSRRSSAANRVSEHSL